MRIYAGSLRLRSDGVIFRPERFFLHPNFNNPEMHNDIALVKLTEPIEFNEKVQPIELDPNRVPDNAPVTLTGWGLDMAGGGTVYDLKIIDLLNVEYERCRNAHHPSNQKFIGQNHLCTLTKAGEGACNGDSK